MKILEVDLSGLLRVTRFGSTRLRSPDHHISRTVRERIIYLVAEGSITLLQDGKPTTLTEGEVCCFGLGEYQEPAACDNCLYYYLHFSPEGTRDMDMSPEEVADAVKRRRRRFAASDIYSDAPYGCLGALIGQRLRIDNPERMGQLISCFKSCALSYEYNTPRDRIRLCATAAQILMLLEEATLAECDTARGGKLGRVYDTAKRLLGYVETHYTEPITSRDIELEFFINYDYANRIFKRYFGFSIVDYRNRLRIHTAKSHLSDMSIEQVAELVGFSGQYYFARAFKKYEGISPAEYKRQRRCDNEI